MKKLIAIIAAVVAISVAFVSTAAEVPAETIENWIAEGIGEGESITSVTLDDRVLSISVDLSGAEELYPGYLAELADIRTSSITDELLDHEELDADWDILFFSYEGIGVGFYTKDDIRVNEYGLRYIEVYNEDGSTKLEGLTNGSPATQASGASSSTKEEIQKTIEERVTGHYDRTEINRITINDDLGTAEAGDYIALVYLTWNVKNKGKTARDMLVMYSDDLAATVADDCSNVQEIAVFWTVPYLNDANAKRAYERGSSSGMYLSDEMWNTAFQ